MPLATKDDNIRTIMVLKSLTEAVVSLTEEFAQVRIKHSTSCKVDPIETMELGHEGGGPTGRTGEDKPT